MAGLIELGELPFVIQVKWHYGVFASWKVNKGYTTVPYDTKKHIF